MPVESSPPSTASTIVSVRIRFSLFQTQFSTNFTPVSPMRAQVNAPPLLRTITISRSSTDPLQVKDSLVSRGQLLTILQHSLSMRLVNLLSSVVVKRVLFSSKKIVLMCLKEQLTRSRDALLRMKSLNQSQ